MPLQQQRNCQPLITVCLSVYPCLSGSLINGHDERDFEDKKVSHMKQKRRIIAANDNVQKETEGSLSVRWREEKEEELKLSQENWKDRKRERQADGLRTVANFGNYCDAEQLHQWQITPIMLTNWNYMIQKYPVSFMADLSRKKAAFYLSFFWVRRLNGFQGVWDCLWMIWLFCS